MKQSTLGFIRNEFLFALMLVSLFNFIGFHLQLTVVGNEVQDKKEPLPDEYSQPKIILKKDSSLPLRILSSYRSPDIANNALALQLTVQNISKFPISAYAVRYEIRVGNVPFIGAEMSLSNSPDKAVQVGASDIFEFKAERTYTGSIKSIYISIDFVELANGVRWGHDTQKFGEYLDGFRVGAKGAFSYFNQLLQLGEIDELVKNSEASGFMQLPDDASWRWKEGHSHGQRFMQERLKYAYKQGGARAVESALYKPIDAIGTIENLLKNK